MGPTNDPVVVATHRAVLAWIDQHEPLGFPLTSILAVGTEIPDCGVITNAGLAVMGKATLTVDLDAGPTITVQISLWHRQDRRAAISDPGGSGASPP